MNHKKELDEIVEACRAQTAVHGVGAPRLDALANSPVGGRLLDLGYKTGAVETLRWLHDHGLLVEDE